MHKCTPKLSQIRFQCGFFFQVQQLPPLSCPRQTNSRGTADGLHCHVLTLWLARVSQVRQTAWITGSLALMLRASHTTEGQNRDAGERGALIHQSKAYLNNCLFINRRFFEASSVELPLISPSQLFSQSVSLFQHIMMLSVHKANKYPFSESIASKYRASKKTTLLLFNQAIDIQWTARNPHADLIREPVACWQSSDPWHWSDTKTCRFFFFFSYWLLPVHLAYREKERERGFAMLKSSSFERFRQNFCTFTTTETVMKA